LLHRRGLRPHRPQGACAAVLGKSVPFSQPGQEPLGESRLPAQGDRAHSSREASALHREVHDRRRAAEIERPSQGGRAATSLAGGARCGDTRRHGRRAATPVEIARGAGAGELMHTLLTNDDGILAHGLDCLEQAAKPLGEVTVVAPDREQSATRHSLTLHHPIRPVPRGDPRWQIDGTPTDCVMLAVETLMSERPDFVLSGINHGQNMGEDVLYSGTVAAAMEGLSLGIPSVAISFAGGDLRADVSMLKDQIVPLRKLLEHILALTLFPAHTLLNINPPPLRGADIRGWRLTRLGRRVYSDSIKAMQ